MRRMNLGERPTGRSDLEGWYSAALTAQERSGLSVTEYAHELGVTASTLYRWQRRLRGQGENEDLAATPFGLVEVGLRVDGAHAPVESEGLVVRVGGDRRIEVPRGFDGDHLRRLVTVLESC